MPFPSDDWSTRGIGPNRRKIRGGNSLGAQYRSKRAGGDVVRKGMLQPYAFIPLDPRAHSKKNKAGTVEQYSSVIASRRGGKGKRK